MQGSCYSCPLVPKGDWVQKPLQRLSALCSMTSHSRPLHPPVPHLRRWKLTVITGINMLTENPWKEGRTSQSLRPMDWLRGRVNVGVCPTPSAKLRPPQNQASFVGPEGLSVCCIYFIWKTQGPPHPTATTVYLGND